MKTRSWTTGWILAAALATGCGGGGGGNDDLDLSGSWTVRFQTTQNTCGPLPPVQTFQTTVQQSDDEIRFQDNQGSQYVAVIDGSTIRFGGDFSTSQQGCTLAVNYSGTSSALTETRIEAAVQTRTRFSGAGCLFNGRTCDVGANFTMTR